MSRAPRPDASDAFAADVDRIARVIELSEGFILQPIVVPNHDVAGAIIDGLEARGIAVDELALDTDVAWQRLLDALHSAPQGQATLVYAESLAPSTSSALRLLNQKRDSVAEVHAGPLLWVTTPALDRMLWEHAPDLWSIAAIPIRLLQPAPAGSHEPVAALTDLVLGLFNAAELRRFVSHFAPALAEAIQDRSASLTELVVDFVSAADRHGFVDGDLFAALLRQRPRQGARIREVAALWGIALSSDERRATHAVEVGSELLSQTMRGPAGALKIVSLVLAEGIEGGSLLDQVRQAVTSEGDSMLVLSARASDDTLAGTPADWRARLREAVGTSLREWLGSSRWLVVAVIDPLIPEQFCDPADFSAPESFAEFFVDLLERDLGDAVVPRLSISLLVRFPGRTRRELARRLRSRIAVEFALLQVGAT